jgi:hypothetical protein
VGHNSMLADALGSYVIVVIVVVRYSSLDCKDGPMKKIPKMSGGGS